LIYGGFPMFPRLRNTAACVILSLFATTALAAKPVKIETGAIVYKMGPGTFEGLVARPAKKAGKLPAILMIHNWMGVTAETKKQAERMASLGFVVLAADIYGQGVRPKTREEAAALAGKFKADRPLFREHLNHGLKALTSQPGVDPSRVFAVGYCFGGTGVLELARSGADVKGVVSFHGGLDSPSPADGAHIKAKVLVLHGADDPFVKLDDIVAFQKELRDHKVDWQMISFGGAVHSFTDTGAGNDPASGAAYNAVADARSFAAFKEFVVP
jgi:dienelactone hydrolase